jgi:adenine phosphoribosyltransferase
VADFPKPGILFKDITPILGDGILLRTAIDCFVADCAGQEIRKIVGIDARGFLFGATVADRLGIGFVPIRKRGKLPWKTESLAYKLEYGEAAMEVHTDAFEPGERVSLSILPGWGSAAAAEIQRGKQTPQPQFPSARFLMARAFCSSPRNRSCLLRASRSGRLEKCQKKLAFDLHDSHPSTTGVHGRSTRCRNSKETCNDSGSVYQYLSGKILRPSDW